MDRVAQMTTITRLLPRKMRSDVPEQDLSINLARVPAVRQSRFVIRKVNVTHQAEGAAADCVTLSVSLTPHDGRDASQ